MSSACPEADTSVQSTILKNTSKLLAKTQKALRALEKAIADADQQKGSEKRAQYFHKTVMARMDALRQPVDELEMIVDKDLWPMPSYGDLIFEV